MKNWDKHREFKEGLSPVNADSQRPLLSHNAEIFINAKTGEPLAVGWYNPKNPGQYYLTAISGTANLIVGGRMAAVKLIEELIS